MYKALISTKVDKCTNKAGKFSLKKKKAGILAKARKVASLYN